MNVVYVIQAGHDGPVRVDTCAHAKLDRTITQLQAGNALPLALRHLYAGGTDTLALLQPALRGHRLREHWYFANALGALAGTDVTAMPFDADAERRRLAANQLRDLGWST